jgi:hypothetical protein
MDFAPAFTAGTWAFWWLLLRAAESRRTERPRFKALTLAALAVWWGCSIATIHKAPHSYVGTRDDILEQMATAKEPPDDGLPLLVDTNLLDMLGQVAPLQLQPPKTLQPIPGSYTNGFDFASTGIIFNGSGWWSNGVARASMALFVEDPECLILDVAPANPDAGGSVSYTAIRAKIGLEFLERESMTPMADGMRIVFRGPQRKRYQRGVQVVFLAMVPVEELSTGDSPFRLLRVAWRRDALEAVKPGTGMELEQKQAKETEIQQPSSNPVPPFALLPLVEQNGVNTR